MKIVSIHLYFLLDGLVKKENNQENYYLLHSAVELAIEQTGEIYFPYNNSFPGLVKMIQWYIDEYERQNPFFKNKGPKL